MDSIHSMYQDNKQTTMDSFEINLKQIEHTNKLLDNIELKLTDFFAKKSLNENFFSESGSNHKNYDLPKLLLGDSTASRRLSGSPDSVQHRASIQAQRILDDRSNCLLTFGTSGQLQSHLRPSGGDNLNNQYSRIISDGQFQSIPSQQRLSVNEDNRTRGSVRNDSSDRILELEDCYQTKVSLLQNRIKSSESEIRKLKDENKKLSLELNTIRKTIGLSREQFLEELKTALYDQQNRLAQEFIGKLADKEEIITRINQENCRLSQQNETLKSDNDHLAIKNEKLMAVVQELEKEKGSLFDKYQNLMSIQNEMIQIDVQRNGRFSNDTSSFLHFSNQKELKGAEKNKSDETKNEIRAFVDNIELYRKELEELKYNNLQIREQFHVETERIKADLRLQKEQNFKLIDQLRQQQLMNQQLSKVLHLKSKSIAESSKEKSRNGTNNSDESRKEMSSKVERTSSRGLLENFKENNEHAKENRNYMNLQERGFYPGETRELVETLNDSTNFPFTNPQIKIGWSKGRKSVPKIGLLNAISNIEQQQNNKRKELSKPKTERHLSRTSGRQQEGTSQGLEEELRKLKAHVNSKIPEVNPSRRLSVKASSNTVRIKNPKQDDQRSRERSASAPRRRLY